jgi:hypothetical protein
LIRALIPLVAIAALTGCNRDEAAENAAAAGGPQSVENMAVNDVTAIDAVTGDAANMAADVDWTNDMAADLNSGADGQATNRATTRRSAASPDRPPRPATEPVAQPAANNSAQPANTTE